LVLAICPGWARRRRPRDPVPRTGQRAHETPAQSEAGFEAPSAEGPPEVSKRRIRAGPCTPLGRASSSLAPGGHNTGRNPARLRLGEKVLRHSRVRAGRVEVSPNPRRRRHGRPLHSPSPAPHLASERLNGRPPEGAANSTLGTGRQIERGRRRRHAVVQEEDPPHPRRRRPAPRREAVAAATTRWPDPGRHRYGRGGQRLWPERARRARPNG